MSATARGSANGRPRGAATPATADVVARRPKKAAQPDIADALKRRLTRLALDVHDGPMQNLAVIGFSLGDLRRTLQSSLDGRDHAEIDAGMELLGAELGRVESELRALITALEDEGVTAVPLTDAIRLEIEKFQRRWAVAVDFQVVGDVLTGTDSQRIALEAVTRAALANVGKHAAAHNVWITLTGTDERITLEIEDDGRGFRVGKQAKSGRMGLSGMRKRIELLGGEFVVKSRPGGPTKITASVQVWHPQDTP
jgi:signal transduction histidine kinase